jgi:small-conductance mechanosensitive channel
METSLGNLSTWLQQLLADAIAFIPNLIISLIIFLLGLYLAGLVSRLVRRGLEKREADLEMSILLETTVKWSFYILGTTMALNQVGFNLTAFLAGLGILGFTVGFAIQDVSKNFIAGMLLLIEQPFDIGDGIEVAGFSGKVLDVDLRATEIEAWDGRIILIPNADVFTNPIINFTKASQRRIEFTLGVANDTDLSRARQVALEAVSKIDGVLQDPPPKAIYGSFGDFAINLTLYYWVSIPANDYLQSQDAGVLAVNQAFKAEGIEMPYPTQSVILHKETN